MRILLIILLFFETTQAQNSLLQEAKKQLTLEPKKSSNIHLKLNKNIIKVPIIKDPPKAPKKNSVGLLFGKFSNKQNFFHPKLNKLIGPAELNNSPLFGLQTQSHFFNLPFKEFELDIGVHLHLFYSQIKSSIYSKSSYDEVRLTNYFYGLGPNISIAKKFKAIKLQLSYHRSYGQLLTSLVSASESIDYHDKQGSVLDFVSLRIFPQTNFYIEAQKNLSKEKDSWNIGLGLLL